MKISSKYNSRTDISPSAEKRLTTDVILFETQVPKEDHQNKMVLAKPVAAIPIIVVTLLCLGVGAVIPWFVKGQNKSTIRTMIVLTAVCCWLFWLIAYMCQLNPLIGPILEDAEFKAIKEQWK